MEPGFIRENGKNSKRFGRTKKNYVLCNQKIND
jgi:hypothetical protein